MRKVNYDDQSSLVEALQGQQVLIITMAATAPPEAQFKLVEAAATANVPFVMPNEYGYDPTNTDLSKDQFLERGRIEVRQKIKDLGKSAYISLICGFWYEFSLGGGHDTFGFDFKNRTLTRYGDGNVKLNTSTWPQCGRAVANLLSLPIESDNGPCLANYKDKYVYISSFKVSQKDVLASALRVTGTGEKDWTIDHADPKEIYQASAQKVMKGDRSAFGQMLYSRIFYPDNPGDFESKQELANEVLGLPKEDLDQATKKAIELAGA